MPSAQALATCQTENGVSVRPQSLGIAAREKDQKNIIQPVCSSTPLASPSFPTAKRETRAVIPKWDIIVFKGEVGDETVAYL